MKYIFRLVIALALFCVTTCLLEMIPTLFVQKKKQWIKASLIANVITNPILNTLLLFFRAGNFYSFHFRRLASVFGFSNPHDAALVIGELLVIVFEAWIYHKMLSKTWIKCLLFSLAANALSFIAGLLLQPFFIIPLDWKLYQFLF